MKERILCNKYTEQGSCQLLHVRIKMMAKVAGRIKEGDDKSQASFRSGLLRVFAAKFERLGMFFFASLLSSSHLHAL